MDTSRRGRARGGRGHGSSSTRNRHTTTKSGSASAYDQQPQTGKKRKRSADAEPPLGHRHHGAAARTHRKAGAASTTGVQKRSANNKMKRKPLGASKWQRPDDDNWCGLTAPKKKQKKKNPIASMETMASTLVFALGPTRKSKSLNRKKLSKKDKQILIVQKKQENPPANMNRGFPRGNNSSSSSTTMTTLSLDLSSDLEQNIMAFAKFVSLTPQERAFRMTMFHDIKKMVRAVFPMAQVDLYGSSSSGLETFRSDLDITVGNLDLATATTARKQQGGSALPVEVSSSCSDVESEPEEEQEQEEQETESTDESDLSDSDSDDSDAEPTFSLNLSMGSSSTTTGPSSSSSSDWRTATAEATTQQSNGKPHWAASAPTKSPWNPTHRRLKMSQLRALQQILATNRPLFKVKCLNKAKIPILMVEDPESGIHIDIGVNRESFQSSDHGRTTALVTELQCALGAPFISVVVFLKEFLHQFELDKPFTGGLGSYRLYMMVAYIFTVRCTAMPSPAKALLLFLEVFGNRAKKGFFCATTELPIRHGQQMDLVDFHAVFRLHECVDKFAMAFDIIRKHGNLGCVVYEDKLEGERRACANRIHKQHQQLQQPQEQQARATTADKQQQQRSRSKEYYYDRGGSAVIREE